MQYMLLDNDVIRPSILYFQMHTFQIFEHSRLDDVRVTVVNRVR